MNTYVLVEESVSTDYEEADLNTSYQLIEEDTTRVNTSVQFKLH